MRIVVLVAAQGRAASSQSCAISPPLGGARRRASPARARHWRSRCATAAAGRSGTRSRSCREERRSRGTDRARCTRTVPLVGSIRPAIRLKMVDLPHPVLPSSATISPRAISRTSPSTARNGAACRLARRNTLVTSSNRMTGFGASLAAHMRALRHRAIAERGVSISAMVRCTISTKSTSCRVQASAPAMSNNCCCCSSSIADAAGRADQLGHHHHARGVAEIDLPGGEDVGKDGRQDHHPEHLARVGRNDITISNRSFDMPRKASSTWNVNAGSDVITMMKRMRGSVP